MSSDLLLLLLLYIIKLMEPMAMKLKKVHVCSASHYWFQIPSQMSCCLLLTGPPANSTLLLHQSTCLPPFPPPLLLSPLPFSSIYHLLLFPLLFLLPTPPIARALWFH